MKTMLHAAYIVYFCLKISEKEKNITIVCIEYLKIINLLPLYVCKREKNCKFVDFSRKTPKPLRSNQLLGAQKKTTSF